MPIPNILFCYFAHSYQHYIPLDVGYAIAQIKNGKTKANCYATRLGVDTDENLLKKINNYNPDAVFFFTDHLTWAGANYYNKALRLTNELNIFKGIVSNKHNIIDPVFDIAMPADNEYAFSHLYKILQGQLPVQKKPNKLDDLPSPYLTGIFDSSLKYHSQFKVFSPFIYSSRGCIHKCHYCFRSVREDHIRMHSPRRFMDEVEYIVNKFPIRHFHILDDCFIISSKRMNLFVEERLARRNDKLKDVTYKVMCRLDKLDEETTSNMKRFGIKYIQLGLQTINPKISHYMNRNMSLKQINNAMDMLNKEDFNLQIDLMLGLPNDTFDCFKKSLDFAVSKKPQQIQVRQLYLTKGTEFYNKKEEYLFETKQVKDGLNIITSAVGFDYKDAAYKLLKKTVAAHPEIKWMWTTDDGPSSRLKPKELLK